ncbi:unnamed protein product [Linum tenue]|uniref:Uncharacterized protein n=1 Tax=Linum tenue TaxID=586396 RepID=A0AAV0S2T9_9ROSI|nr:unnamed protein product [Linum tenue]
MKEAFLEAWHRDILANIFRSKQAVLMHDPIGSSSMGRLPSVKNQGLLHPHSIIPFGSQNLLVDPCGLPVTRGSRSIRTVPIRVLGLLGAEEVPLLLQIPCHKTETEHGPRDRICRRRLQG